MYFFPRTNFLAKYSPVWGGIRVNSGKPVGTFGVLQRTFARVWRSVGVCKPLASSPWVRASLLEFVAIKSLPDILPFSGDGCHHPNNITSQMIYCIVLFIPVPRSLQLYWRGYLEDSRSFNGDPPHLTLNHGFPVIRLSRPKKVA